MRIRLHLCILMLAVIAAPLTSFAHPDVSEEGLLAHWAVAEHEIKQQTVDDVTHQLRAKVHGTPRVITQGPAQGWWLDGASTYFEIARDHRKMIDRLPRRQMSVSAWVVVKQISEWGGLCGVPLDTGDREAGESTDESPLGPK